MSKTLLVRNLHSETSSRDLHALCAQFGTVLGVEIMKSPITGDSRGAAYVEMSDGADAAIDVLNRFCFQGNTLVVCETMRADDRRRKGPVKASAESGSSR
jgi:RNA recognition motif-containing protein